MQEQKINELEYQNNLIQLQVKQKEKEARLAELKIKELKQKFEICICKISK